MRLKIGLLKGLDAGLYEAWQIVPLCRRFHHRAACAAFFANFHNFFFQLFPDIVVTSHLYQNLYKKSFHSFFISNLLCQVYFVFDSNK